MTFDGTVLVVLVACFVVLLRQSPVHSSHPEWVMLQQHIDELLTLARQNDIAMTDLDNRIADLQEARDGG